MEEVIIRLASSYPLVVTVLTVIGTLYVIIEAIIALTPSKKDDEMLLELEKKGGFQKVKDFLKKFSLIKRKDD